MSLTFIEENMNTEKDFNINEIKIVVTNDYLSALKLHIRKKD